jgi:hypothetical protein
MFAPSFPEILIIATLLPFLSRGAGVPDLLSLLEPQAALETLGEKTDEESIRKLIEGLESTGTPAEATYDKKEAEGAIQNLASATESVRDKAREKLAGIGPALRARLEEVVAKDARRADEAKKVLAALDSAKSASGQRRNAARQLAIQLAADKSLAKLLPAVREAEKAKDPFVARAATVAVARLEKTEAKPGPATTGVINAAIEALPKATSFLIAVGTDAPSAAAAQAGGLRLATLLQGIVLLMPDGQSPEQAEKLIREATQQIAQFAVTYGNMRLGNICLANVGGVGPQGAGLAIIVSGDYDRVLLENGLEKNTALWTVGETAGRKVFTSIGGRLLTLDDHTVLILPPSASKDFPLVEYLAAFKDGKQTLRSVPRWAKFLETLKAGSAAVRGLAITDASLMSEIYGAMDSESDVKPEVRDAVKGMKELELDISPIEGSKVRCRLEATFAEGDHAKNLADYLKSSIQEGIASMEQASAQIDIPQIKIGLDIARAIKVSSEGKKGILRLDVDPNAMLHLSTQPELEAPVAK